MNFRIDELALATETTVDTIRFYQSKGLLDPPRREGRVALYSDDHVERLRHVRDLKGKGFTLASIKRLLDGDLDEADVRLAESVADAAGRTSPGALLTPEELTQRTGVSTPLLEAIEREGLIETVERDGRRYYTESDAATVQRGLELLSTGLPLSELLSLAREHDSAMREVARRAVDVFIRFVRDPLLASGGDKEEAAAKLVEAFDSMLPATTDLVARHFERLLISEGLARLAQDGDEIELEAVRGEQTP